MSKETTLTSQAATTYATDNIIPVLDKLATLDASVTSQNKLLAYHVFETCLLAGEQKVTHKMLETAINRTFDKRVSAKGRKVADYVINEKPFYSPTELETVKVTAGQFQGDNPELHVMTVYGHIAAYEKKQRETKADTKSVVEQSLAASGLPIELAEKQIALAQEGNDAAMQFVKQATEGYKPVKAEKSLEPVSVTPSEALDLALDALVFMAGEGDELATAQEWLRNAIELIGTEAPSESESETIQTIAA